MNQGEGILNCEKNDENNDHVMLRYQINHKTHFALAI